MAIAHNVVGNLVDVLKRRIFPATITVQDGRILDIRGTTPVPGRYLIPGFVDAHIHVESSMLTPTHFGQAAVVHGTVATVSDPHEIANVLGIGGVQFMLEDAKYTPLKICFGVPSCVPATSFESAGANLDRRLVAAMLDNSQLGYLSEMMNYPEILDGNAEVAGKIQAALDRGKPVDGHAPGLRGAQARAYIAAGISTDHECTTREEALDKLAGGCQVQIRQGSAAKIFEALFTLIDEHPDAIMFCSDDKHPDDLLDRHINQLVREAVARGMDPLNTLQVACVNPVKHYHLDVGLLRVGDPADFVEVDDLSNCRVLKTWIAGELVAEDGQSKLPSRQFEPINKFLAKPKTADDFRLPATSPRIRVIDVKDGELATRSSIVKANILDRCFVSDTERDVLKITVINRYQDSDPAVGFVRGIGLKQGAIASSVAHDCHNIIAVGTTDKDLCAAVNLVIANQGGLVAVRGTNNATLALPLAGLMSTYTCKQVAVEYQSLKTLAKSWGTPLREPFMTLSFLALLVIPELKLSDLGLFDARAFKFVEVAV